MMTDVCACAFFVCIIERLRQASMRSQATQTEGYYNSTTSLSYPSCYSGAGSVTDRYKPPYLSSAASILNFFLFLLTASVNSGGHQYRHTSSSNQF
jgi:hypothetical protein